MRLPLPKVLTPLLTRFAAALLIVCGSSAIAQAPLTLFNGISLVGWAPRGSWSGSGGVLSTSGAASRGITTAVPFEDYNLSFDYNESAPMNARLRLWAPREGAGGVYVDLDSTGQSAGIGGIEGVARSHIAAFAPGWHHVQVEASHGQLSIHVDGQTGGTSSGGNARAGYLGWEVSGNGTFQVRSVKLVLAGLTPIFNGTDLSNWKSVAHNPNSKKGVGHDVAKTLTFGMGGGSVKPHAAKWNVQAGAIHGEDGPGGLEYSTPIDDAIFQLTSSVKGEVKADHFTALNVRDTSGQLDGGYGVGIGPYSGSIEDLAKHAPSPGGVVDETVIIAGRTIAMWVGGNLYNVYTDSRPESTRVAQGARESAGTITFVLPGDGVKMDVSRIAMTALPKNYGSGGAPAPTPIATAPSSPATTPAAGAAAPAAPSAAETAMLAQQKAQQQQADSDRQSKQKVASLMALALSTSDPAKQMDLYNQVVQIDPSNAPAVQGYKDAQTKLQTTQANQEQQQAAQVNQQHDALTKDQQVNSSLVQAQGAFLAGHLKDAGMALNVAERLAPDNPLVRDLRSRINATSSLRSRLFYLSSGAGLIALAAMIALFLRRRRQHRYPMLEITAGMDVGEQFSMQKDVIRIGAVAQDGGQKNDIVVRDIDRAISRFHCEIAKKNGQLYLTDLKSSNGTRLGGVPLQPGQPALLRRGDRILLADVVELRFGYARQSATKNKQP